MRTITILLLLSALALAMAGCASQGDMQNLQRDMDEAKNRIYQLDKELRGIRLEAKEGTDTTAKGLQKELESVRKLIADLQASQDNLRVDMQSLSGKLDDVRQTAQKPSEELSLLKEDTERRLAALEAKIAGLEKAAAEGKAEKEAKAKVREETPESIYQGGLDAFKGGDMKKARDTFTKFLGLYPKDELAANAHYWIGETYYNEKNYEQAILEYQDVIKNYAGKEKVPAAMFKQGMAFQGLGDAKSARYIFRKLIDDHPRSEEAKKAKERLKAAQ